MTATLRDGHGHQRSEISCLRLLTLRRAHHITLLAHLDSGCRTQGLTRAASCLGQRLHRLRSELHHHCYNASCTARTLLSFNLRAISRAQSGRRACATRQHRSNPCPSGEPYPIHLTASSLVLDFILPAITLEAGQAFPAAAPIFALSRSSACTGSGLRRPQVCI